LAGKKRTDVVGNSDGVYILRYQRRLEGRREGDYPGRGGEVPGNVSITLEGPFKFEKCDA